MKKSILKQFIGKIIPMLFLAIFTTGCGGSNDEPEEPKISVKSVSLSKTAITKAVGETETLTAIVAPSNATNKAVTWKSSDDTVATVDANGKVTAKKNGTAKITVTTKDGNKTATCTVTVKAATTTVAVTGVSLSKTAITKTVGETEQLTATVAPNNATNKAVTWKSSDDTVATVDANGKVTAKKAGTATITVTTKDGNKTATCTVTVKTATVNVTEVTVNKTEITKVVGGTEQLTATVKPTNATNQNVTWSSDNEAVATVDANGKVTAKSAGTAKIKVTTADGNKTATCTVTVKTATVNVTGVEVKSATTLLVGGTETLTATVKPSNATNQNVTWSSDNQVVATVDTNGKVTAKSAGTAKITVTTKDGNKTATCTVTVKTATVNVTGVEVKSATTITVGGTETLTATVKPTNATNQNVSWSSDNEDVATVDANGRVTAKKVGTAKIKVTTTNGKTDTCTVTVKNKNGDGQLPDMPGEDY